MNDAELAFNQVGGFFDTATASQMFGKKCYKTGGGKAFVCFYQDAMVFKLSGNHHAAALALNGSKLFDPSGKGRAMKEWVQVLHEHEERWLEFATFAYEYVDAG